MNIRAFIEGAEDQMRRMQELVDFHREKAKRYRALADAESDAAARTALLKEANELEISADGWEDTHLQLAGLVKKLKAQSDPS